MIKIDEDFQHQLASYWLGILVACLGIVGLLAIGRVVLDPAELATIHFYLIKRSIVALFANAALGGGLLFINLIAPIDFLRKIGENSHACAFLAGIIVFVVGYLICYA